MNIRKVTKVTGDYITFDDESTLSSEHRQDCCESHYLDFSDLTIEDFEKLEFDLTDENFFNRIEGYGIELTPIQGHSVRIPGYGYNNGYYSSDLDLIIHKKGQDNVVYNIIECQKYDEY